MVGLPGNFLAIDIPDDVFRGDIAAIDVKILTRVPRSRPSILTERRVRSRPDPADLPVFVCKSQMKIHVDLIHGVAHLGFAIEFVHLQFDEIDLAIAHLAC